MVHTRETRHTVRNTVNNCQIQGIIIQNLMEAIGETDAENEEKNHKWLGWTIFSCALELCSLAQFFSFCL